MEVKQAKMAEFVADLTNQLSAQKELVTCFTESQNEALLQHTQQAETLATQQQEFHKVRNFNLSVKMQQL